MKPLKLWSLILLMSCSGPQFRPNNNPPKETPKALQDQTSDIRSLSKRTNNDLVEELYQGLAYEHTELKAIEKEIANVEREVLRIESMFSAHDFYEKHGNQMADLTAELAAAKRKADTLYARWHELEELKSRGERKPGA